MSFNKIILVGNLGRDPELRYTPQGTPVCSFSMATNERRKAASGEMQDQTTWFRVTLWGKQAENASKFLQKGRPVYIEGRLRTEEWTDKDGKTRSSLEVHATDMQFIGGRGEEGARDFSGDDEPRQDYRQQSAGNFGGGSGGSGNRGASSSGGSGSRNVKTDYDDFDQSGGANDEDIPF